MSRAHDDLRARGEIRAHGVALETWLAFWRVRQRYHRYTVDGIEKLDGAAPALVVGYHGRPIAYDICLLSVALHDRLGYLPHGIVDRNMEGIPVVGRMFLDGLGCVTGDDDRLRRCVEQGEHVLVTPGGSREGLRSMRTTYEVRWGERVGYLRLALRHGLRIVPVAASGVDHTFLGLWDWHALAARLGVRPHWPIWSGVGLFGMFPFAPPLPVRIRQLVGDPIDPADWPDADPERPETLRPLHAHVQSAVQNLLDQATAGRPATVPGRARSREDRIA